MALGARKRGAVAAGAAAAAAAVAAVEHADALLQARNFILGHRQRLLSVLVLVLVLLGFFQVPDVLHGECQSPLQLGDIKRGLVGTTAATAATTTHTSGQCRLHRVNVNKQRGNHR